MPITITESQTQKSPAQKSPTQDTAGENNSEHPYLELRLFGAPQIHLDGEPVGNLQAKDQALLIYLALTEQPHLRTSLATLFWGERPESNARTSLRRTIQNLRRALPAHIDSDAKMVRLASDAPIGVDVLDFIRKVEAGTQPSGSQQSGDNLPDSNQTGSHQPDGHQASGNQLGQTQPSPPQSARPEEEIEHLTQAIALYRADFLAGFSVRNAADFDDWQAAQLERLRKMLVAALQTTSRHWVAQNDSAQAISTARRVLEMEPWNEEAQRQLMILLAQNGERHSALVQYESFRHTLRVELDVDPSPQTVALYQQIRDGELEMDVGLQGGKAAGPNAAQVPPSPHHPITLSSPHLFGVDAARDDLLTHLQAGDRPWILSIDGIGGIGKTSLAQSLVSILAKEESGAEQSHNEVSQGVAEEAQRETQRGRENLETGSPASARFTRIAWVSAKQEEFQAGFGIKPTGQAALDVSQLVDELLEQLTNQGLASTPEEKERQLLSLLKEQPSLVVIDNLETVADYEALVPTLREFANPSKFLITSRHSLASYNDVYTFTLGELATEDAAELLQHEATMRGIRGLSEANHELVAQITTQIMQVVGGHPLALNLVLGQLSFLPLDQVLTNLEEATGQQVDEFYTYIYWQAWQILDLPTRQLLLAMPMCYNYTYTQVSEVSQLVDSEFQRALTKLIGLSLVQVSGDLLEPRYRLHRLTETFLMNEVIKWGSE